MEIVETQKVVAADELVSTKARKPSLLVFNSGGFQDDFHGLCSALEDSGCEVRCETSGAQNLRNAMRQCSRAKSSGTAAGVIATWNNGGPRWLHELASWARHSQKALPLMLAVNQADPQTVSELLLSGVRDFVTPPFNRLTLQPRIVRLIGEHPVRRTDLRELKRQLGLQQFVGSSPALADIFKIVPKVAASEVSVLIFGETGTGKEICARAIHYLSRRAAGPFVPVNCGAIPANLVENELFGHASGAYTSANASACGVIQQAAGGTLFLDEIDALPPGAQVALLRFLQNGEVRPVGASRPTRVDVRVLSATNANLQRAVDAKTFRQDLLFRLNVVSLRMPPLRERGSDIELLALHFLERSCQAARKVIHSFAPEALRCLAEYHWPGNVRELENIIERAVVLCEGDSIKADDLAIESRSADARQNGFALLKAHAIAEFEKRFILESLHAHQGNVTRAAQAAGKHRRAFWALMRKHGICRQDVLMHSQEPRLAEPTTSHQVRSHG